MTNFKYPNGQTSAPIKQSKRKEFARRGMDFEEAINQSNLYYRTFDLCVVHKKPTPIQIVKVDYPKRSLARIREAYFRQPSTTDYNGVYQGKYLDFEAKETKNRTSFPFSNFHPHQINHLTQVLKQDGIAFVLLYFATLNRIFFYPGQNLVDNFQHDQRKSLPLTEIEKNGIEIIPELRPRIPYLKAVDLFLQRRCEDERNQLDINEN